MLTGPSLVGQLRLMDMLEALSPQRCLYEALSLNNKRITMYLPRHGILL